MLTKLKQWLRRPEAPPAPVEWLECADLAAWRRSEAPAIVDVRNPDEFDGPLGHIEGAVNMPVDQIVSGQADFGGLRDRQVVLVCRTDKRSARAAEALRAMGVTDVHVLRGGMDSWRAVGLPVVRNQHVSK
jgi:rhodanese-related sulfurtransferase